MATRRRSSRVTTVSPWIYGGEGQLRDLFPMPPALFLAIQVIKFLFFRHWYITLSLSLSTYLYLAYDWPPLLAFIFLPIFLLLAYNGAMIGYLWYKNPVPIIKRK